MLRLSLLNRAVALAAAVATLGLAAPAAQAQDKVRVGVFLATSALPYYVAVERGYFKEVGIETEAVPLATHPLIIQSMVKGDIDAASNVVTLEVANINALRPGTAAYISLNGQNAQYITEQFVIRNNHPAKTLKELKGTKLLSAPGPANVGAAKAVLKTLGLEEGKDYTMQEQQMGVHVGAIQAGTFDGGYTLEPMGTMMIDQGIARRVEGGVIATHLLGRKDAFAHAAGGALSQKFMTERPDVAARYARAWAKAVADSNNDPKVRELLVKYMRTPANIAPSVPLVKFFMVKDMETTDVVDFQRFVNIGVEMGVVKSKVDVRNMMKVY
jgi:NitT/TauT family transport system substrate-binding protein